MIRELISGTHTGEGPRKDPAAEPEDKPVNAEDPAEPISNSLDDVLLNYIMKRSNK